MNSEHMEHTQLQVSLSPIHRGGDKRFIAGLNISGIPDLVNSHVKLTISGNVLKVITLNKEEVKDYQKKHCHLPGRITFRGKGDNSLRVSYQSVKLVERFEHEGINVWPSHKCLLNATYKDGVIVCEPFKEGTFLSKIENGKVDSKNPITVKSMSLEDEDEFMAALIEDAEEDKRSTTSRIIKERNKVINRKQETYDIKYHIPENSPIEESFRMVTPELAEKYLNTMIVNRPQRNKNYFTIREAIVNGRWDCENGENIKFDINGVLVDGQHRMQVIKDTGITTPMRICSGVTPKAKYTIDSGVSRNGCDALYITGWPSSNKLSGVANRFKLLSSVDDGDLSSRSRMVRDITNIELVDYVNENRHEFERALIEFKGLVYHKNSSCAKLIVWSAAMLFARKGGYDKAIKFIGAVCNQYYPGARPEDSPMNILNIRFNEADKKAKGNVKYKMSDGQVLLWLVKGWNAYIDNTKLRVSHLRLASSESIPKISVYKEI